jgi:flagellin
MGLRINQNIAAMNAYRNLSVTDSQMSKSLEKLSSGFRINRAADDAAGLSISEGLRAQVGGLKVAVRNAQDGVSVAQTAEGALTEVHSLLQRMRDLSVQASNTGANNTAARDAAKLEVDQAIAEIDRISASTEFNGTKLLQSGADLTFQVGANSAVSDQVAITRSDMSSTGLSLKGTGATSTSADLASAVYTATATTGNQFSVALTSGGVTSTVTFGLTAGKTYDLSTTAGRDSLVADIQAGIDAQNLGVKVSLQGGTSTGTYQVKFASEASGAGVTALAVTGNGQAAALGAQTTAAGSGTGGVATLIAAGDKNALTAIDNAIKLVSEARSKFGAYQNRFEHTINNLNVTVENLSASESRIRDADMAQEMVAFTRTQILSQAGTSMLAQANQAPQSVLSLLR